MRFDATMKLLEPQINSLKDTSDDLDSYQMELISNIENILKDYKTMLSRPDWWWTRISKEEAIKILKRHKHHDKIPLPFEVVCFEYDYDWENWTGLDTDDIETLEEDEENYYENFELWF